jgi:hypothetical protein
VTVATKRALPPGAHGSRPRALVSKSRRRLILSSVFLPDRRSLAAVTYRSASCRRAGFSTQRQVMEGSMARHWGGACVAQPRRIGEGRRLIRGNSRIGRGHL